MKIYGLTEATRLQISIEVYAMVSPRLVTAVMNKWTCEHTCRRQYHWKWFPLLPAFLYGFLCDMGPSAASICYLLMRWSVGLLCVFIIALSLLWLKRVSKATLLKQKRSDVGPLPQSISQWWGHTMLQNACLRHRKQAASVDTML